MFAHKPQYKGKSCSEHNASLYIQEHSCGQVSGDAKVHIHWEVDTYMYINVKGIEK